MSVVQTSLGPVEGVAVEGGLEFRGIPYAGPVSGARRFRRAVPAESWTEPLVADTWPPMVPQAPITNPDPVLSEWERALFGTSYVTEWSEDGLHVNVWTPAADGGARPVMVWLHGGGFVFGQATRDRENGRRLSVEEDVVVVAPSHRLGATGYLDTRAVPGVEGDANVGLTDLVLALEWVRDNAAAFGGDPGNVTVFGESGGAFKVHALLAVPSAEGLFHQAICQSGVFPHATLPGGIDADRAAAVRDAVLAQHPDLREADAAALTMTTLPDGEVWQPVLDGEVLPAAVPEAARTDVPLMLGWDRDEFRVLGRWIPIPEPGDLDGLTAYVGDRAEAERYGDDVEGAVRDAWFGRPTVALAERQERAYLYQLRWRAARDDVAAGHGVESGLLFGNLGAVEALPESEGAEEIGRLMRRAWASFARTGVPVVGDEPWPAYDERDRATVLWELPPRVERDPDGWFSPDATAAAPGTPARG